MKRKSSEFAALAVCCLVICGCGSEQIETAEVSGVVTLDGKPLEQGTVTFTPSAGRGATGQIATDGRFTLSTYDNGDGAIVGTHKIAVICSEEIAGRQSNSESLDAGLMPAPQRSLIPAKYTNDSTSGLTFEVKAGQENEAVLNLASK